jgi:uncharacterized protein with PQ loop repeat
LYPDSRDCRREKFEDPCWIPVLNRMNKFLVLALLSATASARTEIRRPGLSATRAPLMKLRGGAAAAPTKVVESSVIQAILTQVAKEVSSANTSPAKFLGFVGAFCNWFLGLSAVLDSLKLGPEVIALPMTLAMLAYSLLFSRWAGWDVTPKNYILSASHMFNVAAQANQLRRVITYKLKTQPGAKAEVTQLALKAAAVVAVVTAYTLAAPSLITKMPAGSFLASKGGPFTIHPWPPVTKLFLSAASLADLHKPTSKISLAQYGALTLTGFIFSFYGLFVTPINYPLTGVNIILFLSSLWHLTRKIISLISPLPVVTKGGKPGPKPAMKK